MMVAAANDPKKEVGAMAKYVVGEFSFAKKGEVEQLL